MKHRNLLAGLAMMLMLSSCAGTVRQEEGTVRKQPGQTDRAEDEKDRSENSSQADPEKTAASEEENDPENEQGPEDSETAETKIRLEVPQKIQETDYYCAVACLQMVLACHGISMDQTDLAQRLHTHPVTGMEYEDLAREASVLIFGQAPLSETDPGYRAVLWNRKEGTEQMRAQFEARVKTDLEAGDPVFLSINSAPAYGTDFEVVHEVVLYGADYEADGAASMYYFLDPSSVWQDPQHEGRKMFSPGKLWEIMNDNPEPGYVF